MKKIILAVLVCVTCLGGFSVKADGIVDDAASTTVVNGKVTDRNTGEGLAGARILVKETGLRIYSDFEGNFVINNLRPGTYSLEVELISYHAEGVDEVAVSAGCVSTLNIEVDPQ
jgi:hypothetical protein